MTERIPAASQKRADGSPAFRMMFVARAAGTNASILFDSGASHNYVSTTFAKLTGIAVSPSLQKVRLGSDQEVAPDGEATVYVQIGSFHKPVKCLVMSLLFEVGMILGDGFMTKYDCILQYGRKCLMIQKGKRHITVKTPSMHRDPPEESDDVPNVLCASQLKRDVRRGESVFLASLKLLEPETATPASTSPSVQPGHSTNEKSWVSDLIGEFFEVFQDPLPDGLPPMKKEVHSIPTESGHPPPFRQMYRLSSLEFRELEKQVKTYRVVTDASDIGVGGVLLQEGHPMAYESRGMYDRSSKPGQAERLDCDQSCASTLHFDLPSSLLKSLQLESQVLCEQIQRDANRPSKSPGFCVNSQGLVIKDSQVVVLDHCGHLKRDIMEAFHDTPSAGHYGIAKTCKAIQREDVARYVTNCVSCARNKARRHAPYGRLQTISVPEKPSCSVSMDLIIKLPVTARGHDSICVFVDRLTKMVHFVPCKEKLSAKGFAELYVDNVFRYHGLSQEFISDRDSRFTSEFWKGVTELLDTRLCVSSSFHPQTDGQTERVNQTLEAYLCHFVSSTLNDWDLLLLHAEIAHNNAFHESFQATPFYLNHGRHPRTPMGGKCDDDVPTDFAAFVERLQSTLTLARKLLIAAQQRQKAYADKHMIETSYKVGERVLLSTKYLNIKHGKTNRKLLPKWIGPFKGVQKVGPVSYKVEMNPGWRVHPVFHVSLVELYKTDGRIRTPPPPIGLEGAREYEVETILKHQTTGRKRPKTSYLIQWKGYGPEHNS
jgi:hypothetical protein